MAPVRTTGAIVVAAISISMAVLSYIVSSKKKKNKKFRNGLIDAIGNTPLIRINSLSDATGCEVNIKQLTFSIFVSFYHLGYLWFSILLSILSGCRLFFILRQVSYVKD